MEYRNSFGQRYGPRLVSITRCDLGQSFELNLDTSEYTSASYPPMPRTKEEIARRGLQIPTTYVSDKPTLRIEITTTDTGERKELFGHIARHVVTTRKQIPLEGSHSQLQQSVTDAWYIDLKRRRVKGVKQLGQRSGNWLTLEQGSDVLSHADGDTLRAKRDHAMLAMLLGCGLRRSELTGLEMDEIQTRQGHWAIVDLIGKGGHVRTVPIPQWVKHALDVWRVAAGVTEGRIFRAVSRAGKVWGEGISQNVVWYVVRSCCRRAGLDHIVPHDLRRTCAKLCHASGGELEQIQFLLGHASVLTTERYLGCKQNLGHPVNDRFSLKIATAA
jgi:integrase